MIFLWTTLLKLTERRLRHPPSSSFYIHTQDGDKNEGERRIG